MGIGEDGREDKEWVYRAYEGGLTGESSLPVSTIPCYHRNNEMEQGRFWGYRLTLGVHGRLLGLSPG